MFRDYTATVCVVAGLLLWALFSRIPGHIQELLEERAFYIKT
jgi:hypothetical protein